MSPCDISPATTDDIDWILSELKEFNKFYGTKKSLYPASDEAARGVMEALIGSGASFISRNGCGVRTGFIVGHLAHHPFNADLIVLTEIFWWVSEIYRNTRAGHGLKQAFVEFGKSSGADWIHISMEVKMGIPDRVFERDGFIPFEKTYLLET